MVNIIRSSKYSVLFSGVCALILSMGIARYSFTPMIPFMQEQMNITEGLAGWLAGFNYIGYLVGLFMVWLLRDLRTQDFFYRYGLLIAVISTAIMGLHEHSLIWYLSRFFAGISTALVFMLGTGLIANWLERHGHKEDLGIHFAGLGLGIIIGALIVDFAADALLGGLQWQGQWFALAAFGAVFAIPATLLLPIPDNDQIQEAKNQSSHANDEPSKKWLLMLTVAYVCAGFSNTINVTFTSLITESIPLENLGILMWIFVGVAAAPAPFVWEKIAHRLGFLNAIRIAFVINIASNLLMAFTSSAFAIATSSLLFGFSFMGIVALTLRIITYKYRYRATQVMAQLTLGYSLAQIASPILSGVIAERMDGRFDLSLCIVSIIMALGLVCLSVIKREGRILPSLRTSTN